MSQALLAEALYWGDWEVRANAEKARAWVKRSAEQSHPLGLYLEASHQYLDRSTIDDIRQRMEEVHRIQKIWQGAIESLLPLADAGGPHVSFILGEAYDLGRGVERDRSLAREWYQRAADAGHVRAMVRLGSLCQRTGTAGGCAEAVAWYRMAAELGSASGMMFLAFALREGRGTASDPAQAVHWFKEAVKAGDAHALIHVGRMYAGPLRSPREAVKWFRRAVKKGLPEGREALAMLYDDPKSKIYDPATAMTWWQAVAEDPRGAQGRAMLALARHHRDGIGTDRNAKLARQWLEKAMQSFPERSRIGREAAGLLREMEASLW